MSLISVSAFAFTRSRIMLTWPGTNDMTTNHPNHGKWCLVINWTLRQGLSMDPAHICPPYLWKRRNGEQYRPYWFVHWYWSCLCRAKMTLYCRVLLRMLNGAQSNLPTYARFGTQVRQKLKFTWRYQGKHRCATTPWTRTSWRNYKFVVSPHHISQLYPYPDGIRIQRFSNVQRHKPYSQSGVNIKWKMSTRRIILKITGYFVIPMKRWAPIIIHLTHDFGRIFDKL